MSPETLRLWQRRNEVDAGTNPVVTTDATARFKRLGNCRVPGSAALHTEEELLRAALDLLGTQYYLAASVEDLLNAGYLRRALVG